MTAADARFVSIYETHYRDIYAYCRRRTGADRVDDAVAEVFLVAWRRISDVPHGEGTLPWLYRVAYRVMGHQFRGVSRSRRLRKKLSAIGVESSSPADEYMIYSEESHQILEALSRLRDREQEILRLSIWEELSHEQISSVLGITVDATKQRLSRARKSLAREYDHLEKRRSQSPAAQKGGAW